jgi:hypothetical protein
MGSIVTSKFRIHNAEQFVESFTEAANTVINLFIGRSLAFEDDNDPPTPVNSTANIEFTPWRDMYALKRIQSTDVTHSIPRYNWTSGTFYEEYDDQNTSLLESQFYVLNSNFDVYKCLSNAGDSQSTTEPTGTSTNEFQTADGYIWKYMYTVSTARALKFLTNDYMPVQTLASDDGSDQWDVQQAATDGEINFIRVFGGGSGYFSGNTTVTITGDGSGATANATVTGDAVSAITVTAGGSGYTIATATITGAGSGATANVIISPKGGHGANPIEELGGKYVMINARLDGSESNTFSTANEFRQVGLVRDAYSYGTTDVNVSSLTRQTYRYTLSGVSGTFVADETVSDSGSNTATVIEWDSDNSYLYTTLPLNEEFANAETLTTSSGSGTIIAINTPGLQPYTGDLLYVENRVPIARSADQIEDIKLVIQF